MTTLELTFLFGLGLPLLIGAVALASKKGFFEGDRFPTPARRKIALLILAVVLAATILLPAANGSRTVNVSKISFVDIFAGQALLASFLLVWWILSGRPPLLDFLALRSARPWSEIGAGVCLGLIGWSLTLVVGIVLAIFLGLAGVKAPHSIPPLVQWIASLSWWKRGAIVLCAMTLEEFHFRAFLQRRFGPIVASIFFLMAHGGYGEPLFLLGLSAITTVLAISFKKTGAVLTPILAHGTFDAIQLFIVLPWALKFFAT